MTKVMVVLFSLTLMASSLVACNTVHGVGQDVEKPIFSSTQVAMAPVCLSASGVKVFCLWV